MKCARIVSYIYAVLMAIMLCGCSGGGGHGFSESVSPSEVIVDRGDIAEQIYRQNIYSTGVRQIVAAPVGYYALEGNLPSQYLTYIDKNDMVERYLCGKPECSHVEDRGGTMIGHSAIESCDAYVGEALRGSLCYNNGYIYLLRHDSDNNDVTLMRVREDGTEHEDLLVVGQVAGNGNYYSCVFNGMSKLLLSFNNMTAQSEDWDSHIYSIDINIRTMTELYSEYGSRCMFEGLRCTGGEAYFISKKTEHGEVKARLVRLDLSSLAAEELAGDNICSYVLTSEEDAYIYREAEGLYHLESDQETCIREADENFVSAALSFDGRYLYLDNTDTHYLYNKQTEMLVLVCDVNGSEVARIDYNELYALYMELSDENNLVAYSYRRDGIWTWAYIKKSDLPAGGWRFVGD